ncbi:MAG: DUF6350 family protein [Brachybacterium sp.]|nr:DUF6350 family protein [Brachybacterium sp.]
MTSNSPDRITSPWVMGAVAGLTALGIGIVICVVPALAAQLAAVQSGMTVLDAILLALNTFVLGHGGGLVLTTGVVDGAVTLTPLGLSILFVLACAASMRRMGRAMTLLDAHGDLRPRALRDGLAALGVFAGVYGLGGGVVSATARSELLHAVTVSAVVGCAVLAALGGLLGLLSVLRRPSRGHPGLPLLELLPQPYDAAVRGTLIALLGLFASGMITVVGAMAVGAPQILGLHDQLHPGIIGGIVLTLLQLALLPTFGLWALAALVGGSFAVGIGTSVSLGSADIGVLPALPLLGALPQPGEGPWYLWLLLALPVAAIGLGAYSVVRDVAELPLRRRAIAWGAYPALVLLGGILMIALSAGAVGNGRLSELGPHLGPTLLGLLVLVVGTTGLVLAVWTTPLIPRTQAAWASLRRRVEAAEATERGEHAEQGAHGERAEHGER